MRKQDYHPISPILFADIEAYLINNYIPEDEDICFETACCITLPEPVSLEAPFSMQLFQLIKDKNISETDCYKRANLDRRLFSKIRSNSHYQPRKNTVFALIIGLRLDLDEANDLLDCAGYTLSHSIKSDVVMEYIIEHQIYDMVTVNEILYSFDCPLLGTK